MHTITFSDSLCVLKMCKHKRSAGGFAAFPTACHELCVMTDIKCIDLCS